MTTYKWRVGLILWRVEFTDDPAIPPDEREWDSDIEEEEYLGPDFDEYDGARALFDAVADEGALLQKIIERKGAA